jgi:hypothetical protein
MINLLVQYFIKNGQISLTGIGTLKLSKNEAFWDEGKLIAPNEYIILEKKIIDNDDTLIQYLANELDISIEETTTHFAILLEPFIKQQVFSLNFGSLGTFHKNGAKITWNSLYKSDVYFKNVSPDILKEELDDNFKTPNTTIKSWLIWTIIILTVSILLILYKNISH